MDNELQQQIQRRFAELPADIQAAIQSTDFSKKIQAIGAAHRLHIDQMGSLEDETMLVMLGFSLPTEFAANVAAQLQVPLPVAQTLAQEISNEIFVPIRESMQQFYEHRAQTAEVSSAAQAAPLGAVNPQPTVPAPVATPISKVPVQPALVPQAPAAVPPANASTLQTAPKFPVADALLSQKTVTPPNPPTAPAPASPIQKEYSTDPYREPTQ